MPSPPRQTHLLARLERHRLAFAAIAFALGVLPWLPTLSFAFAFDDEWTIVGNEALRRPLGALWKAALTGVGAREIPDVSRPVMVASNWLDLRLWGLSPAGHHLSSVLLHGLVAVAAAFATRALLLRTAPALAAVALFCLAPGHAEAVAAINYREDLLAALGVFTALAAVAWPRRAAVTLGGDMAAAFAFLFALLAKESALALAPMVALLALAKSRPRRWLARRERLLTLLAAVVLVWSQWRWALALAGDGVPRATQAGGVEVLARLGRYLGWSLVTGLGAPGTAPVHGGEAPWAGFALVLVALAAGLALLGARRRRRALMAAGLWLGGALGSSPLLGPRNEEADRYLVLGSLGLSVGVVLALLAVRRARPRWALALGAGVAVGWAGVAVRDARLWRDDATLWAAATARAPDVAKAWVGLAWVHRRAGALPEARAALDVAIARDPDYAPAWVSRAYVSLLEDDTDGARRALARVDGLSAQATPGYQRAKVCLELTGAPRLACARGEAVARPGGPR